MKPSENDIALVEKYFDAELNEEELQRFTSRVEQDESFKSLVQREKTIISAIRNQHLMDNLQYLKSVEEKLEGTHSLSSPLRIKKWYYYAAAAAVVLLVAVTFLLPSQQQTSEQLF